MATDNASQSNPTIDDIIYPEMDIFMDESKSDVVFVIDGQRVPANRSILKLKSEVFQAMFSGRFKESTDDEIQIKDTTVDAFKTMLQYLYTDKLVLKDDKDLGLIDDVLALADKYLLKDMALACDEHIIAVKLCNLSLNN